MAAGRAQESLTVRKFLQYSWEQMGQGCRDPGSQPQPWSEVGCLGHPQGGKDLGKNLKKGPAENLCKINQKEPPNVHSPGLLLCRRRGQTGAWLPHCSPQGHHNGLRGQHSVEFSNPNHNSLKKELNPADLLQAARLRCRSSVLRMRTCVSHLEGSCRASGWGW